MSTYFNYENSAYSASAYNYDSSSAWYSDCNSVDFSIENNMAHPPTFESSPWEPVPPNREGDHLFLNTGMIKMLPQFHGFAGECPHEHLEKFYRICSAMKPPNVADNQVFLRAFFHSLKGAAKDWKTRLPRECVIKWENLKHLFLKKFPPVQQSYNNNSRWNDPGLGWYEAPQKYQEASSQSTFMPKPVQQQQRQYYDAPAQITPQPSTSEPTMKELLEQITMKSIQFEQIQQETQVAALNLTDQIKQMANVASEETAEYFEAQAGISNTFEPGRPPPFSTTFPIFKEVEVSIPQYDYGIHECVIKDYADDRYADNHIVAEHVFNSPSEHESESVFDNACNFKIDSYSEDVSEVQPVTLGLGVIPLHEISMEPYCTNLIAGGTNEFDQHASMLEDKGASIHKSFDINRHLLNLLINNPCIDPAVENISLLDQIWRMKQFVLKTSWLDREEENISLQVQNWQLPP
ncbi:hypothetical protein VIGAN_07177500 [Vigna angularis var. angularis]|uniref:Retrotransposon gag domain-containing protein n=3 Tax=Vigna angularis var. angularis TaxID=157739 RepID=A0A0S3SJ88_PHAAN|nr:hypothetical protein VIGAN_07177500 [Vigna angularis var. angularis]